MQTTFKFTSVWIKFQNWNLSVLKDGCPKWLNTGKTELLIIRLKQHNLKTSHCVLRVLPLSSFLCQNLGVLFDPLLSFDQQGKSPEGFLHLRNIVEISPVLSTVIHTLALIHAFISSRLDYCNAMFSGLPDASKNPPFGEERFGPVLSSLDWLPISAGSD